MNGKVKALALLSGGLDSSLALKLVLEQGIDVTAVKFTSPFCTCDQKGKCFSVEIARKFNIPYKTMLKGENYLKIVRKPKYGYGKGMNPCIDCRIYMLKKAKQLMKELGAEFIVTGEVLGQRPMSQYKRALKIIERDSFLEGKILRPLSAKLLPVTEPERGGLIDRERLLTISGRSRKIQLSLAKEKGIDEYACAAGGCLLTQKQFAAKVRDLFKHKKRIKWSDILLLKVGRHFRFGKNKIIVGRNELENEMLLLRKQKTDYVFEVPGYGSPITILQGNKTKEALLTASKLTARYSDSRAKKVVVKYGRKNPVKRLVVEPATQEEADRLNLTTL